MLVEFTKMHGTLNDFVIIEDSERELEITPELSSLLLNRRAGIGGDQLLLIRPCKDADFEMRIFNSDGSEVEMCGNGIRCAALYAVKRGIVSSSKMSVKTLAGYIRPVIEGDLVRVDMGPPQFEGPLIPVDLEGEVIDHPLEIEGEKFTISCVSLGNPHCVIFVDEPEDFPVGKWGPLIETHPLFPNRINVEFVKVADKQNIRMRVWERGSGETLACGTGACAAAVICHRKGLTGKETTVHLDGGDLVVRWSENHPVYLIGPGAFVFEGKIEI